MNGAIPISTAQLLVAAVLVIISGTISALLRIGVLRSLLWGTFRTIVQLIILGYILVFLFSLERVVVVFAVVALMVLFAAHTARGRAPHAARYSLPYAYLSLFTSTFLIGVIVCALIVRADPWFQPRVAIPIAGMILGNSMNGIALALDRLSSETRSRAGEIEGLLLFGASPWEAIRDPLRVSLRAGMIPTLNAMKTVGLVFIPGMMTGQILGGVDPMVAVRYQIVVMLMIGAAVAIGSLILLTLYYRRLFTEDEALSPELLQ
jgi:putative ABC transport system permease protein